MHTPHPSLRSLLVTLTTAVLVSSLATGCGEDADPPAGNGGASAAAKQSAGSAETPATKTTSGSCKTPEKGRYMAEIKPKKACPWWTPKAETSEIVRFSEDSVQYPFADEICGDVSWSGCSVKDECGPIKLNAGGEGYFAKASMAVSFADDTHASGTLVFDIGHPCKVEVELTAKKF